MYRIPRSTEVGEAIVKVLEEYREVGSQNMLHSLVLTRLKRENQFYKLSPERVKRIASRLPGVKIFVEKRRSRQEAKNCYVCGSKLEWIRARNLLGDTVRAGKKCVKCGFRIDRPELIPRRYVFYKR